MTQRILIGTDEAGYGPNLGPLLITATAWEIPLNLDVHSLWQELREVLTNAPEKGDTRLYVADSKAVYSANRCLEDLEVPVLAFLATLNCAASTIDELGKSLAAPGFEKKYTREIWNSVPGIRLPVEASEDHVAEWNLLLQKEMKTTGIRLLAVESCIMFPEEFNELVDQSDSKGVVLSDATLDLVRSLYLQHAAANKEREIAIPTLIVCDKHGGRNRYDELIASKFDDQFVFRIQEGRAMSRYRLGSLEFCFRTKAEELLPVALASMVSKYLREVMMHQFNAFWQQKVPGLKPTQGYPLDAKRFREQISDAVAALEVPERSLWRNR